MTTSELDRATTESLLARHHVGRMAFAFHDRVTIALVNYVYDAGWVYARMEEGEDRTTLLHHHWVAFEVDEIDGVYDWRAVTVRGTVQFLSDDVHSPGRRAFDSALALIQSIVPDVLTPDDPAPERAHVFRIYVDEMAGRESRSDARGALPPA